MISTRMLMSAAGYEDGNDAAGTCMQPRVGASAEEGGQQWKGYGVAIYHLSLRMIQRSKGQSVVAVAADRARVLLHDRRLDQGFTPLLGKRRTQPILSEILLPESVPERWRARETLWNEVEGRERRRDSSLAREVEFALPAELSPEQASALAHSYVRTTFVAAGMVADLNVHWPPPIDGQVKPYAQALLTLRRAGLSGFGLKERAWNERATALRWRQSWAEMANAFLAAHGYAARIDHRSHAERGIALEPQNKIGPNAARRARRGEPSERVDEHRAIAQRNQERITGSDIA